MKPAETEPRHAMNRLVHVTTVPLSLHFISGQPGFMRNHGFETAVISSPGAELDSFCARENVTGYGVAMARQITPFRDLASILELCRIFRRLRPAIVQAHTPKAGLLAMAAAWMAGVRVRIFHLHGLPQSTAGGIRRLLLNWSTRVACALSNRVLCVSPSVRQAAIRDGLVAPKKIHVPASGSINGVDAARQFNPEALAPGTRDQIRARYGIPAGSRVMGFVGRMVRDKGMTELVLAWRQLRVDLPDLHLLLVGDTEAHDPLPAETAAALRNDSRIHITGWSSELPQMYSAMDVVVLPSYREGLPVVPLEAAAMGLPVIATRVTGCIDAVEDGVTGVLIEARNVEALGEAAASYLRDPVLRAMHGKAARVRVQRDFEPTRLWRAFLADYCELLEIGGLAAPPLAEEWEKAGQNSYGRTN